MGRAPGDERLDAERGQPPAQGLVAAGRGVLGRWFVIGGLCRPPPCQYGSYTLHLFHGCLTTPPLRGRVADSTTDTASCVHSTHSLSRAHGDQRPRGTRAPYAHSLCIVAALNQGTGLMDQAKHVSTHPLTLNITRTHTNLIHRHHTRYITAQREIISGTIEQRLPSTGALQAATLVPRRGSPLIPASRGALLEAEDPALDGRLVVVKRCGPLLLDGRRCRLREDAVLD